MCESLVVKRLENVLLLLRRHALTGVAHRQFYVLARPGTRILSTILIVEHTVACRQRERAAAGHRVTCVEYQVYQRILKIPGVDLGTPQIRSEMVLYLYFRGQRAGDQTLHVGNQLIDVCNRGLRGPVAREDK